jgi:hypothetical protein
LAAEGHREDWVGMGKGHMPKSNCNPHSSPRSPGQVRVIALGAYSREAGWRWSQAGEVGATAGETVTAEAKAKYLNNILTKGFLQDDEFLRLNASPPSLEATDENRGNIIISMGSLAVKKKKNPNPHTVIKMNESPSQE